MVTYVLLRLMASIGIHCLPYGSKKYDSTTYKFSSLFKELPSRCAGFSFNADLDSPQKEAGINPESSVDPTRHSVAAAEEPLVDRRRLELLTPSLQTMCSTRCASGPSPTTVLNMLKKLPKRSFVHMKLASDHSATIILAKFD